MTAAQDPPYFWGWGFEYNAALFARQSRKKPAIGPCLSVTATWPFDRRPGVGPAYLEQYHIAGATVAAVQDGEVVFTRGYGTADVASGAPVEPGATLFRIGSLTKLFTWTAVMQLVEVGKLDLHADVNSYLDFTLPATYAEPITMWHLMTHTAVFENRNLGYGAAGAADLQPLGQWQPAHIPARVRPPGAAAAYSNYGAALGGYIVERAAGQPYEAYIRQHILQPLGMQHTTVAMIPPAGLAPAIATGYTYVVNNGDGRFVATEPPLFEVGPAGSMAATADDMAQFMLAHLRAASNGARLLEPATLATMHATAYQADPSLNGMALGFFELSRHGEQIVGHVGAAMCPCWPLRVCRPRVWPAGHPARGVRATREVCSGGPNVVDQIQSRKKR